MCNPFPLVFTPGAFCTSFSQSLVIKAMKHFLQTGSLQGVAVGSGMTGTHQSFHWNKWGNKWLLEICSSGWGIGPSPRQPEFDLKAVRQCALSSGPGPQEICVAKLRNKKGLKLSGWFLVYSINSFGDGESTEMQGDGQEIN